MRPQRYMRTHWRAVRRLCAAGAGLAAMLAVLPAATGILPGTRAVSARADEQTASQDILRTGWDRSEAGLSPSVVSGGTFKALPGFPVKLNGQVYAQPLVVGSTVIVATENDMVYGINAATGAQLWLKSVGTPYHITTCNNVAPNIGVTGAPVYDPSSGDVYLVAQTGSSYELIGINPSTGSITSQVTIGGRPSNDSHISFNANQQLERPGLLLLNGWVYSAFGSHCDHKPYVGFVSGVNLRTHATTLWTDEAALTDDQAGIWQGGGGLMSDGVSSGSGRIFFTSGNGVSPAYGTGGNSTPGQLAESIVRLAVNSNGTLSAKDFFSPSNAPSLDAADTDWGSGGPIGLPSGFGTTAYPHLVMQAGKDGRIFILNRLNLGGRHTTDNALAKAGPYAGQWNHPAAFGNTTLAPGTSTANDYLYYVGNNDYLRVLRIGANSSGKPTISDVANSSAKFGGPAGSPVVTSNGTNPASAVVWAVSAAGGSGSPGTLRAYAAAPSSGCTASRPCTLQLLWSASTGNAARFSTPATSNGAVYVGTLDGYLYGFGTPGAGTAPLAGPAASFSQTSVRSASARDVSVTAAADATVTGVSAATTSSNGTSTAAQFTVDATKVTKTVKGSATPVPVTFPVTLHKGDTLTAPVTFTPASPGGVTGTLSFATRTATQPSADVPLAGNGIQPGLYANTPQVQFALVGDQGQFESWVPVGISVPREITFTNGGATPETITTENLPPAPFTVTGLPRLGTVLAPGQSFVAAVSFAPTTAGQAYNDTLTVGGPGGDALVSLTSQSLSPTSLFQASPASVNLGNVPVGKQATFTITVTNTGNEPATMNGSSTLNTPFHAVYKVTPQLPVNAGYDLQLPVTFTPAKKGTFTVNYKITWTDVLGTHTLTIPVSGTGV
jgi:hypothetical protein